MAHHVLDGHIVQGSLFTGGLKVMAESCEGKRYAVRLNECLQFAGYSVLLSCNPRAAGLREKQVFIGPWVAGDYRLQCNNGFGPKGC